MRLTLFLLSFISFLFPSLGQYALDGNFGNEGKVLMEDGEYHDGIKTIIHPEGGTLTLSNTYGDSGEGYEHDIYLTRLNDSGELMDDFGQNGQLIFDFEGYEDSEGKDIEVVNSRILLLGNAIKKASENSSDIIVEAHFFDGNIDTTFGDQGKKIIEYFGVSSTGFSMAIDQQGRIIVLGLTVNPNDEYSAFPALTRLTPDGEIDSTFGGTGQLVFSSTPIDLHTFEQRVAHVVGGDAGDVAITSNGKYLISGRIADGFNFQPFIAQINENGALDSSFFDTGILLLPDSLHVSSLGKIYPMPNRDAFLIQSFEDGDQHFSIIKIESETLSSHNFPFEDYADILSEILFSEERIFLIGRRIPIENYLFYLSYSEELLILEIDQDFKLENSFGDSGLFSLKLDERNESGCTRAVIDPQTQDLILCGKQYNEDVTYQAQVIRLKATHPAVDNLPLVYPNPTNGLLYIESGAEILQINLSTNMGQLIQTLTPSTQPLDLSDLENGTYLLTLEFSDGQKAYRKVLVY